MPAAAIQAAVAALAERHRTTLRRERTLRSLHSDPMTRTQLAIELHQRTQVTVHVMVAEGDLDVDIARVVTAALATADWDAIAASHQE